MSDLWPTLVAAATTGLLGSLHCLAMCGPLATAGCTRASDGRTSLRATGGYLLGRLISYATLGALWGAAGHHALHILPVTSGQTLAALGVAVFAAIRGVSLIFPCSAPGVQIGRREEGVVATAMGFAAALVPKRGLGLGLATGLLPCGLLLMGWILAAGTGHPLGGAVVMAVFCAATAPALLVPVAGAGLVRRLVPRLPGTVHGLLWCALAVMVGLRPLWGMATHGAH